MYHHAVKPRHHASIPLCNHLAASGSIQFSDVQNRECCSSTPAATHTKMISGKMCCQHLQCDSNNNSECRQQENVISAGDEVADTLSEPAQKDRRALKKLGALEIKQKVMETSMRRLLRSMRDIRLKERDSGCSVELDKRRRLKLSRMVQILMLQRRNLQLQSDTLKKEVMTLTRKFLSLRQRAEKLVVENINMRKFYNDSRGDIDRKSVQIENLLQNKVALQKQVHDRVDLKVEIENLKFEVKRLMLENHNHKESLVNTENLLKVHAVDKEELEIENSNLRNKLVKYDTEGTNLRLRYERIMFENDELKREQEKNKSKNNDLQMITFEYDKCREKVSEMQRDFQKLERLYMHESDQRKALHNSLQEEKGNLRVLCRCRPSLNNQYCLDFVSTNKIMVPEGYGSDCNGCFTFNRIFRPGSTQREVFEELKPLLLSCADGFNVCIMAYGPTGSGKTYTMQGIREEPGITLRSISELMELCQSMRGIWDITTKVSMLEIHNETIYDLLNKKVQIGKISDDGVDVRLVNVDEKTADTEQDILYWVAKGHKRRKMAATKLNLESSRSHLIVRIQLQMISEIDKTKRSSTLVFCDLAGSESADRIQASTELKVETGYINKSLISLGRVFETLRLRTGAIPYRDSKLTHLLKSCLGGQAKCILIVTVAGDKQSLVRSIKALQFGQKAMQISVGKVKQNIKVLPMKSTPSSVFHATSKQVKGQRDEG